MQVSRPKTLQGTEHGGNKSDQGKARMSNEENFYICDG